MAEREYGIDGLRLLLMMMVITLHSLGHGGVLKYMEAGSLRYAEAWLFEVAAYCAVNCFGMISGYVGVKSRFKISGVLYLWIQVWFYAMLCTGVISLLYPGSVDYLQWNRSVFPIAGQRYWFYTAYFGMSVFSPVLNRALTSMRVGEARYSILAMFGVFSFFQTVCGEVFSTAAGYSVIWLMIMYCIGGYCRLHGNEEKWFSILTHKGIWIYGLMVALSLGYKLVGEALIRDGNGQGVYPDMLINYISPTIVICAIALLAVFSKWKPSERIKKGILILSPSAFSVYLIHDHQLVRAYIMSERFAEYAFIRAYIFPFAIISSIISIFAICIVIDLFRRKVFDLLKVKSICERVCSGLDHYFFD